VVKSLIKKFKERRAGPLSFKSFVKRIEARNPRVDVVIVFECSEHAEAAHELLQLASFINDRKRPDDIVGWWTRGKIGILLFDSDTEDAEIFAHNICRAYPRSASINYLVHGLKDSRHSSPEHQANIISIADHLIQQDRAKAVG